MGQEEQVSQENQNASNLKSIHRADNWNRFGLDFVFHIEDKETINEYVLGIKQAKIDQERKMRRELDLRVMALKINDQEF